MFEQNNIDDIEIKGLIESSFLDWDGKIVTTLYLSSCNLNCPFCHNWELIEQPEKFTTITNSELMRHLRSHRDFIDGICLTGGEPTIYDKLPEFIEHLREFDVNIKLDTNGTNPDMLKDLINENKVEYIAMDIKAPLDSRYNKVAGIEVDIDKIKRSIQIIMDSSVDYEFRTTVVPTLLNDQDMTDLFCEFSGVKKYALQQFVPKHARSEKLRKIKPYTNEIIKSFMDQGHNKIKNIITRGLK